jgi:hypothetical protein
MSHPVPSSQAVVGVNRSWALRDCDFVGNSGDVRSAVSIRSAPHCHSASSLNAVVALRGKASQGPESKREGGQSGWQKQQGG